MMCAGIAPYPSSCAHSASLSRPSSAVSVMTMPTSIPGDLRGLFPPSSAGAALLSAASTRRSASSAGTESLAPAARRDSAPRCSTCITPAASTPRRTALTRAMPSASGVIVTCRARAARSARSRDLSGSSCWIMSCTSERSRRSPVPVSAPGSLQTSSSMLAQVAGSAAERVLASAAANRSGMRPSQSASWTPGRFWTRRRAEAREKDDAAGEIRRASPISCAEPLPSAFGGASRCRSASRIRCSARTCQVASTAAKDERRWSSPPSTASDSSGERGAVLARGSRTEVVRVNARRVAARISAIVTRASGLPSKAASRSVTAHRRSPLDAAPPARGVASSG